jgi:hypothetical protein
VALPIGEAMRAPVGAQQTRLRQRAGVSPVRLDLATALRVHRREVRVGDDHFVPESLQAPRDPLALGCGLDQDPRSRPAPQHLGEPLRFGPHPALDQLAILGEDADLALLLMDVDANMVHGLVPSSCGFDRVSFVGRAYATIQ